MWHITFLLDSTTFLILSLMLFLGSFYILWIKKK